MPFRKENKFRFKDFSERPLDTQPICFKGYEGTKEKLKTVPNWQERFRQFAEQLIEESKPS
jgi:hypothetical protein